MSMKKKQGSAYGSPVKKQESKTLKQDFVFKVLGAEDTYKKYKNRQNLTELIILYRKLVEHYSEKGDKISLYFAQKISTLSEDMPNLQQSDQKVTISMAKQSSQQQKSGLQDSRFKSIIATPISYDPDIKKKERSKNAQIAIQVNKVKKRANAKTILSSYYEQCMENNKIVVQDLKNQRKQLQEKLMQIHKRSLQAASKPIVI